MCFGLRVWLEKEKHLRGGRVRCPSPAFPLAHCGVQALKTWLLLA